ncbi:bifunctional methylenetetrahydrofolate dehydrogenase/methenyltetrahydrofolate cyclohydrolase [Lactococcus nasutitermitis]|uniref:Bifunctional protein FolD n=1 Tax=Lactococcus nasutitermitis TaxID=1652957 RepID=A0ABV9JHJ5_9LACT|nr:bifunctional methylenetetrahydrofolate dehydrogenase/methenyltetrahydrofolate cyclohydrolase [Lactococcus nasutitermitis]
MTIIDGKMLAEKMQADLKLKVARLQSQGIVPGLLVILVGEDNASQIYVRNKARVADKIGIRSETLRLAENVSEQELLNVIEKYNKDDNWHGILVQLPLPNHINEGRILHAIDPKKDVDGFHSYNMGRLMAGNPAMVPSTPAGIVEMLRAYNVELSGKRAVVVGRSNIVGKPMAMMLLAENATVTIAHSKTENLATLTKEADVLVVAIGRANFVTADFIKSGAVVIDVGMNRDENGKLCGDVKFDEVSEVASLITPVPGGVGPMTITMLMEQTVEACMKSINNMTDDRRK